MYRKFWLEESFDNSKVRGRFIWWEKLEVGRLVLCNYFSKLDGKWEGVIRMGVVKNGKEVKDKGFTKGKVKGWCWYKYMCVGKIDLVL